LAAEAKLVVSGWSLNAMWGELVTFYGHILEKLLTVDVKIRKF